MEVVFRRDMDFPSCSGFGAGDIGDSMGIIGDGSVTLGEELMGRKPLAGSWSSTGGGVDVGAC